MLRSDMLRIKKKSLLASQNGYKLEKFFWPNVILIGHCYYPVVCFER